MIAVSYITTALPWNYDRAMQEARKLYGDNIIEMRYHEHLKILAVKAEVEKASL